MRNKVLLIFTFIFLILLTGCKKEYSFSFKDEEINIKTGETYTLEYDTTLEDVTFEVDDSEIISIEGNVIKGLKEGLAVVYVNQNGVYDDILVNVEKAEFVVIYHNLYIDGDLMKVRHKSLLSTNLRDYFNGAYNGTYDDKTFIDWYLDAEYKTKASLDMEILEDTYLYGKYEVIEVTSELRVDIENIVGYDGEFNKNASVQTFSPSYGTYANSNIKDYSDYAFVYVEYDPSELDYFVTKVELDGEKQDAIIPFNGFIVCLKKDSNKYLENMNKLTVGAKITLSKYSIIKSHILYVNETYNEEAIEIDDVSVDCKYYSVYDVRRKEMIYSYQGDKKAYPASVTKVITALAALSNAKLEDTIVVGDELDITYEGSSPSVANIKKGEKWSLRQLLYALLLPSGNDAGYEIAALTINSKYPNNTYDAHTKIRMFADLMNEVCAKVGANNSHFMTPDGNSYYKVDGTWDERISNHYLTANDMSKIANYAFTFGAIAEVVKTASIAFKIESGQRYSFNNTNSFLKENNTYYFEYVVGLKTGTTTPAGACLVSAAEKGRRFVIVSTFYNGNSAGRYVNSRILYNLVFK